MITEQLKKTYFNILIKPETLAKWVYMDGISLYFEGLKVFAFLEIKCGGWGCSFSANSDVIEMCCVLGKQPTEL